MDIQHRSGETKGEFYLQRNGSVKASLTYSRAGEKKIIIDHTEVAPELRGENIGQSLVEHAVGYARDKGLKVIPLCPYARSVIEKDKSLQDVL
jgi:predicted GNAT family acetyltransferase